MTNTSAPLSRRWIDRAVWSLQGAMPDSVTVDDWKASSQREVVVTHEAGDNCHVHLSQAGSPYADFSPETIACWADSVGRQFLNHATSEHFTEEARGKAALAAAATAHLVLEVLPVHDPDRKPTPAPTTRAPRSSSTPRAPRPTSEDRPAIEPNSLMGQMYATLDLLARAGVTPRQVSGNDICPTRELGVALASCDDWNAVCDLAGAEKRSDTSTGNWHRYDADTKWGLRISHACMPGLPCWKGAAGLEISPMTAALVRQSEERAATPEAKAEAQRLAQLRVDLAPSFDDLEDEDGDED